MRRIVIQAFPTLFVGVKVSAPRAGYTPPFGKPGVARVLNRHKPK